MQTTNHPCACEPCGCSVNPEKPSRKKARFTAPSHVLMVMPVMSNVALVVVAANYSQQSHPCKSSTLHSFNGTTDTQLTTFESRRLIPLLIPELGQLALHCRNSCNSISQDVEVLLNSPSMIKIPGKSINAELTPRRCSLAEKSAQLSAQWL